MNSEAMNMNMNAYPSFSDPSWEARKAAPYMGTVSSMSTAATGYPPSSPVASTAYSPTLPAASTGWTYSTSRPSNVSLQGRAFVPSSPTASVLSRMSSGSISRAVPQTFNSSVLPSGHPVGPLLREIVPPNHTHVWKADARDMAEAPTISTVIVTAPNSVVEADTSRRPISTNRAVTSVTTTTSVDTPLVSGPAVVSSNTYTEEMEPIVTTHHYEHVTPFGRQFKAQQAMQQGGGMMFDARPSVTSSLVTSRVGPSTTTGGRMTSVTTPRMQPSVPTYTTTTMTSPSYAQSPVSYPTAYASPASYSTSTTRQHFSGWTPSPATGVATSPLAGYATAASYPRHSSMGGSVYRSSYM